MRLHEKHIRIAASVDLEQLRSRIADQMDGEPDNQSMLPIQNNQSIVHNVSIRWHYRIYVNIHRRSHILVLFGETLLIHRNNDFGIMFVVVVLIMTVMINEDKGDVRKDFTNKSIWLPQKELIWPKT